MDEQGRGEPLGLLRDQKEFTVLEKHFAITPIPGAKRYAGASSIKPDVADKPSETTNEGRLVLKSP
jgi:hypothetical protein